MGGLSRRAYIISWVAQITAAVIMGQTLFFKFTAAPESVALFTMLGVEPFGRIGIGIAELVAVVLLLRNHTAALGGLLGVALMSGAILSHLTVLGIVHNGDGGTLFGLAVVTWMASAVVAGLRWKDVPVGRLLVVRG